MAGGPCTWTLALLAARYELRSEVAAESLGVGPGVVQVARARNGGALQYAAKAMEADPGVVKMVMAQEVTLLSSLWSPWEYIYLGLRRVAPGNG